MKSSPLRGNSAENTRRERMTASDGDISERELAFSPVGEVVAATSKTLHTGIGDMCPPPSLNSSTMTIVCNACQLSVLGMQGRKAGTGDARIFSCAHVQRLCTPTLIENFTLVGSGQEHLKAHILSHRQQRSECKGCNRAYGK
jgi:hypothetical protein